MIDQVYTEQLEAENEKLRQQLIAAQEVIDYSGAIWHEEANYLEIIHRLCIGNLCLGVINNDSPDSYRCVVIQFENNKVWRWRELAHAKSLKDAKHACEFTLGFGKEFFERGLFQQKAINGNATKWMCDQIIVSNNTL